MAFRRYARAVVTHARATETGWSKVRTAATRVAGNPSTNLVAQASEILGRPFVPSDYLLTHCSIVASVDVEVAPSVKLGSTSVNGKKHNVRWADFRITQDTEQWINHNRDAFARQVLLKAYPTFCGAQNFVEHIQKEELSKGRILDVVLRDLGKSLYADILVATDRRHQGLVADIESGKLTTLSMGASVENTTCTQCGNVATDEVDMCDHVRYHKGEHFYDELGQRRMVAELCGHPSLDPVGGVTFIEASWVETPAFTGAVMRNVIEPADLSPALARQAQAILSSPPPHWVTPGPDAYLKAAGVTSPLVVGRVSDRRVAFDFGGDDSGDGEAAAPAESDPFTSLEDDITRMVMDRVKDRVKKEMDKDEDPPLTPEDSTLHMNDSLIKEATAKRVYSASIFAIVRAASSDADAMNRVASFDATLGIKIPVELYRAALSAGAASKFADRRAHLSACTRALGRSPTRSEVSTLTRLGRVLDAVQDQTNEQHRSSR